MSLSLEEVYRAFPDSPRPDYDEKDEDLASEEIVKLRWVDIDLGEIDDHLMANFGDISRARRAYLLPGICKSIVESGHCVWATWESILSHLAQGALNDHYKGAFRTNLLKTFGELDTAQLKVLRALVEMCLEQNGGGEASDSFYEDIATECEVVLQGISNILEDRHG